MQAPRNWRNKVQRYRLTGVQYSNGEQSLLNRPHAAEEIESHDDSEIQEELIPVAQVTAA